MTFYFEQSRRGRVTLYFEQSRRGRVTFYFENKVADSPTVKVTLGVIYTMRTSGCRFRNARQSRAEASVLPLPQQERMPTARRAISVASSSRTYCMLCSLLFSFASKLLLCRHLWKPILGSPTFYFQKLFWARRLFIFKSYFGLADFLFSKAKAGDGDGDGAGLADFLFSKAKAGAGDGAGSPV